MTRTLAEPTGRPTKKKKRDRRFLSTVGLAALYAFDATWRVRCEGPHPRDNPGNAIYAFWHQRMLPFIRAYEGQGIRILVSEHGDGEIIARIARHFGYQAVRGSTTRGGMRALRELRKAARRGHDIAITPDGPRGPRHRVQPGVITLARVTGLPIYAAASAADRAWWFGSWDRFMLPKPFARILVRVDPEPMYIPRDARGEEAVEGYRKEFEDRLRRLTVETEIAVRPPWVGARLDPEEVLV